MEDNQKDKVDKSKQLIQEKINSSYEKLRKDEERLEQAKKEGNLNKINALKNIILLDKRTISLHKADFKSIRADFDSDIEERKKIFDIFYENINKVVSDDVPMVFHGNNNIETVKDIIKSGGLLTPEEQGFPEGYSFSYATQIDVTSKTNTQVTLEFAEPGLNRLKPYGAIFAFIAKDSEKENVFKTKESTEVYGGVNSVKFTEPRFIGIITTNENLEAIKQCLKENGLDVNKAFTHQSFLDFCKQKYKSKEKESEEIEMQYSKMVNNSTGEVKPVILNNYSASINIHEKLKREILLPGQLSKYEKIYRDEIEKGKKDLIEKTGSKATRSEILANTTEIYGKIAFRTKKEILDPEQNKKFSIISKDEFDKSLIKTLSQLSKTPNIGNMTLNAGKTVFGMDDNDNR